MSKPASFHHTLNASPFSWHRRRGGGGAGGGTSGDGFAYFPEVPVLSLETNLTIPFCIVTCPLFFSFPAQLLKNTPHSSSNIVEVFIKLLTILSNLSL